VQLDLERVVFVPVGQAPHREIEDDPGAEVRQQMCEAAVEGDERFVVSRVELERDGPSYTVDTLRQLESAEDELVLILGGDQAASLASWHEPEEVLRLATVAAVERTGWPRERIAVKRVVYFDMPRVDVSSTLVRHRAARGEPIRYLVPEQVASYIEANGLYATSTPAGSR
jgi:nicotinate-nucleotide adenylyltransferase